MSEGWELNAREVLTSLVKEGRAPNGIAPAECGPFEHHVQALYDAHGTGGTEKVREVWTVLTRVDSRLATYLAGGDNARDAVVIRWAGEALQPQAPPDWIIQDVIAAGNVVVVVGEPGSKKTWLLLDAGVCVASGEPWLGKPTKQMTVLLIDEESGVNRLNRRLGAIMKAHDADERLPLAYACMSGLSLLENDAADRLVHYIQTAGAGFVVIDALADVMLGGDENAVKDVQRVFYNLRRAAERTGAAIVVIHHTSKAGNYRGSSAIKGAVDLMLMVESKPKSPNIDIATQKSRDTEPFNLYATARFEDEVTIISSSTGASASESLSDCERHVLRYLAEHGDATVAEIKANSGKHSEDATRQAIYSLKGKGKVERKDDGSSGVRAIYGVSTPDDL